MSDVQASLLKGPVNTGTQVGSSVQLKCMFSHKSCENMSWSRVDQTGSPTVLYAGSSMSFSYGGRYNVSVSAHGECILIISVVELSDAGTFTCSELNPEADQQSKHTATLTVVGMFVVCCQSCAIYCITCHSTSYSVNRW